MQGQRNHLTLGELYIIYESLIFVSFVKDDSPLGLCGLPHLCHPDLCAFCWEGLLRQFAI